MSTRSTKSPTMRLLGGEQLVPQRIKLQQRRAGVGLGDVAVSSAGCLPCACHDLVGGTRRATGR